MAWDCRLISDFYNHPKTIRLLRLHGGDGVVALQRLWCFATEYRPSGIFAGMEREDLLTVCYLTDNCTAFIDDLVKIRFLDLLSDGKTYALHNWEARQPNVVNREKISAQKSAAANARHAKNRQKKEKAEARKTKKAREVAADSAGAMQVPVDVQCPNPTQPNHKDTLSDSLVTPEPTAGERASERFFELIRERQPKAALKNPDAWATMLQTLIDAGQTVEELVSVMQWAVQDSFWASRILSPKAFAEHWVKAAVAMGQAATANPSSQDETRGSGMSAEAWEAMKRQRKDKPVEKVNAANGLPP